MISPLCFIVFSFFTFAKDDLRHQRAAAHAQGLFIAVRAGGAHFVAELLKGCAVPRGFDIGSFVELHLIAFFLIEGARHHQEIRADVAGVTRALAGVERFGHDGFAVVDGAGHVAGVHTHLKGMAAVHLGEKHRHARVVKIQHIRFRPLPGGLVQQKDHRVDPGGEIVLPQAADSLVDAVFAEHIVDIGLHARVQQHLYGVQRVNAPIPAHRHRAAIFFADCGKLGREAVAGGGEVGDEVILPADLQQFFKVLVLVGVAPAAEGKLVAAAFTLLRDPPEVLDGHIGLLHQKAALVAADARLGAQPRFAVDAVAHHAHVDQMRERSHERVHARVAPALIQYPRAHIRPGFGIERGFEMIFFVVDDVFH